MLNPYRHLTTKITALLRAEAKLSKEERRQQQWMLMIEFAGTKVTIGKGDVNTIFSQFGEDGKRRTSYPDQILDRLGTLGAQKHWRYELVTADGESRWFWELDALKAKVKPTRGAKIYGHTETRQLVNKAVKGLADYEWK